MANFTLALMDIKVYMGLRPYRKWTRCFKLFKMNCTGFVMPLRFEHKIHINTK